MSDWQVGDLAVCVVRGTIRCEHGIKQRGERLPTTAAAVTAIGLAPLDNGTTCGCVCLWLADGSYGAARRFRKIRPDEREACEPEFVTLLKRTKVAA